MKFHINDDNGRRLDANVLLETNAITVLSRGGSIGSGNSQNRDYPVALRLILQRLLGHGLAIKGAWVDSAPAQALPLSERQIYFPDDATADAKALFSRFGKRMERVAKARGSIPNKGNRNKRLRIEVASGSIGELAAIISAEASEDVPGSALHLPASDLRKVTELDIWAAITDLRTRVAGHGFDEPTDYELIADDGTHLSPKAVFGLAASQALGFPVRPTNFTCEIGTECFGILESAGWPIIRRGSARTNVDDLAREWAEGEVRHVTHLRRERHPGVARAKKAQMRRLHGKLFCEDCGLDPVALFGKDGEACIEIHHSATEVAEMAPGHITRLTDVECLCANCHRIRHRRMTRVQPAAVTDTAAGL